MEFKVFNYANAVAINSEITGIQNDNFGREIERWTTTTQTGTLAGEYRNMLDDEGNVLTAGSAFLNKTTVSHYEVIEFDGAGPTRRL